MDGMFWGLWDLYVGCKTQKRTFLGGLEGLGFKPYSDLRELKGLREVLPFNLLAAGGGGGGRGEVG